MLSTGEPDSIREVLPPPSQLPSLCLAPAASTLACVKEWNSPAQVSREPHVRLEGRRCAIAVRGASVVGWDELRRLRL